MHDLNNRNFKEKSGFYKYQFAIICIFGLFGFVGFRISVCFTLLAIRYMLWSAKKSLSASNGITNMGGMVINVFIVPLEGILMLLTNYRNPKTGKRETPKWRLIRDTFAAARISPQMYRYGWITLAIATGFGVIYLVNRLT